MYKKILSLTMVCVMALFGASCNAKQNGENKEDTAISPASNELEILKSDVEFSQEQKLSRIKADYLLENNGYKPDDEVVGIIRLSDDSLIDTYLEEGVKAASVAEYANTVGGKAQAKSIASKQSALINELYAKGLVKEVNYSYSTVINAVSVTTTYKDFAKIGKLQGVEQTILSDTFNLPKTAGNDASAIVNNVDVYDTGIFNSSSVSFTGKGTAVAILDSGFDCSHSVFKDQPDDLWIERSDVTGVLNHTNAASTTPGLDLADVWYSNKIPFVYDYADKDNDVFPYDSEHGTHVAGIIGGKDKVITGVAYDTQLVLLKVFPDLDDGANTDDILAALEDAVLLGVDAINMSLGSSCGFAREADGDAINAVYDAINESGISLITAASNSYSSSFGGDRGNTNFVTNPDSGTVGSPSTYAASLSVASISGTKSRYLLGNDEQVIFFNESNSITGDPNDFVKELGITEGMSKEYDYVTVPGSGLRVSYANIDVKGKIALVRRGDNSFEDKALIAKNAGAIACIIYNNVDGEILMSMGKTEHIPTISISKDAGTILASRDEGKIKIDFGFQAGPFMSDFSSWGPTPNLEMKPEITAHGGNIKSAIPGGGYDELSGTSMASPNMCGIVVLIRQYLKEKFPDFSAKEISVLTNQLLMSTASIILNEEGTPYSPRKQGAGLASLFNVVNTKAYITVDGIDRTKLELKDDPDRNGVYTMEFNVVNLSGTAVSYNLSHVGMTESVSTSDPTHVAETGQLLDGGIKAEKVSGNGSLNGTKVTVDANGTLKVKVTYTLTNKDKSLIDSLFPYGMYVEGFIKLTAENSGEIDLNVPFLAFFGDWTQAPMFDKTYYEVESEAHDASIDEEDKIKADYFATTPYGSYFYNYIIPLGTYLYDIDENMYDPIPATEEHIAISNILGTIDGISSVYAGLLRNAKTMTYTITDKVSGEVVWTKVADNSRKAHSDGGMAMPNYENLDFKTAELKLVNNKQYEFRMTARLDYGDGGVATNVRNTFGFDFTLDDEAPVIKEATYEKEYDESKKKDRYYLNLTVYDNHYVMSINPVIFTSNKSYTFLTDNPIPVYGERGANNKVRIEITDFLEDIYADKLITSALAFSIEDYALNSNIYLCQLPGTRGDFKFTKDGTMDGGDLFAVSLYEDEILDLTRYLATSDMTVDADKDYLKYLNWEVGNGNVAAVCEGQVRGLKAGRTMITVTEALNLKQARIFVNVKERPTSAKSRAVAAANTDLESAKIENIRFSYFDTLFAYSRSAQSSMIGKTGDKMFISSLPGGELSFYPGEKIQLFYDLDPWYVADKYKLTFSSKNEKIASVDENGVVTALKKGTTTIVLKVDGSNLMATLRVTVNSEFVIENNMLIAYKGLGGKVVIPDDEGIRYIGAYAFCLYDTDQSIEVSEEDYDANKIPAMNTSVTSVVIPEGVEEIQKYAFYNCTGLQSVTVPSTLKRIKEFAFTKDAKLTDINLQNIEVIGKEAFKGCTSLKTAALNKAFAIGVKAFEDCTALAYVDLSALRNTGAEAFRNCTALKEVKLTEDTKLSNGMFAFSGLTRVEIFEKVQIPDNCFYGCKSLETVHLPDNEFAIGTNCFYGCENLTSLNLKTNTRIAGTGGGIFEGTKLSAFVISDESRHYSVSEDGKLLLSKDGTEIILAATGAEYGYYKLDKKYTAIGESAFSGTDIVSLEIENINTIIRPYAFANCAKLIEVYFPEAGILEVGAHAFDNAVKLGNVRNIEKVLSIGDYAFARTDIRHVEIRPNAVVGEGAFFRSKLEYAVIGEGATFGMGAFQSCTYLKTVSMPVNGGVKFGEACFAYDTSLQSIDLSKMTEIAAQAFYGCSSLKTVNLAEVVEIGDYAFSDCAGLGYVTFPKVVSIGEGAFGRNATDGGAPVISDINLPNTLKFLGEGAFIGCEGLTSVTIPSSLDEVNNFAFAYCLNLQTVVLPDTVKRVGIYSFAGCEYLYRINLGNVKVIDAYAFTSCAELESIDLSSAETIGFGAFASTIAGGDIVADNLVSVGDYAFQNARMTSFTAKNLKRIGVASFQGNAKLKKFEFSNELESIGSIAFNGCKALENFYFPNGEINGDNGYAKLVDGVLYTYMPSGRLQLTSVPAAKKLTSFSVLEGTYRVDMYAANENPSITWVILPDSLKQIGNYAFYGCNALKFVEFRSFTAPALEDWYNKDAELSTTDPGYGLLHNQFDMFGYELYYYNFIDLAGKKAPVTMILPSNDGLIGYDSIVYEAYFGKVENAQRSKYVAMDKNLSAFVDLADRVKRLESITLADERLINDAVTAYNALKQSGTDFGYTQEEWDALVGAVTSAKAKLAEVKLATASITVRKLQEKINGLPDEYSGKLNALLDEITAELDGLSKSDRALLDLTKYNKLMEQYDVNAKTGLGTVELVLAIVIPSVAVLAAAVAVTVILLKRRARRQS